MGCTDSKPKETQLEKPPQPIPQPEKKAESLASPVKPQQPVEKPASPVEEPKSQSPPKQVAEKPADLAPEEIARFWGEEPEEPVVQQEEIIEQALEVVAAEPEFMLTKDFRGTWAEHCFEQREEVFSKIYQAYKRNGEPAQMGNPRVVEEVINALKEGTQTVEHTFTITVKFDPVEQESAIMLGQDLQSALESVSDAQVQIKLVKQVGSQLDVIENLFGGNKVSHNQGEVLLLCFWATWNGPSQNELNKMQEMLEKHQKNEDWTNVRVIGVCIDQENMPLVMQKRVADRKWNLIEHFGSGTSKVENLFEVEEVPYFVLVDKQGMIAWAGNPGSRDIEHDIRSLVNNRGIQVRAENEEPRDEDYVSMNQAFMSVENFKHDTAQLAQELKSLAKKCPRAFLRLENVTVCDLQDFGQGSSLLTCHTVLSGPAAAVEAIQAKTKAITHDDLDKWTNKEQIRKM